MRPYPHYRDSGVEWLGEVPEHWSGASLRWCSIRYAGGTPDRGKDHNWDEGTIPWINSGAVNQRLITEPSALITDAGFAESSAKWIPAGALVIALAGQGRTKGMIAQLALATTCNQSMAAIVPDERIHPQRDERSRDGEGELLTVSHITGVTRRSDKPDVGMFMAETLEGYKVCHAGDLVINTMWAWMGATGVAGETGLVSPSYNVYTPDAQLLPRFVDMAYRSARYVLGITSESRGIWTSRLRLYPQQFLSLVTAVPPIEEQHAIAAHVDGIESESSKIIETVAVAIERLEEYRTALITAAVTGKIDVR